MIIPCLSYFPRLSRCSCLLIPPLLGSRVSRCFQLAGRAFGWLSCAASMALIALALRSGCVLTRPSSGSIGPHFLRFPAISGLAFRQHPGNASISVDDVAFVLSCDHLCAIWLDAGHGMETQFEEVDAAPVAVAPLQLLPCPAVQP